jgi:hypothetical protein
MKIKKRGPVATLLVRDIHLGQPEMPCGPLLKLTRRANIYISLDNGLCRTADGVQRNGLISCRLERLTNSKTESGGCRTWEPHQSNSNYQARVSTYPCSDIHGRSGGGSEVCERRSGFKEVKR